MDKDTNEVSIDPFNTTMPSKPKASRVGSVERPQSKDCQYGTKRGIVIEPSHPPLKKNNYGRIKLKSIRDVPKKLGTKEGQIATLMAPYLRTLVQRADKQAPRSRS